MMMFRNMLVALLVLSAPAFAAAEAEPVPQASDPADAWDNAHLKVPPWTEPSGRGVGIGYQNGSWGGNWFQELRLRVPVTRSFSVHVGGLYLLDIPGSLHNLGGRLILTGSTPVYLNLVRIYGGGGPDVVYAVNQPGARPRWGGGGFFGFEFFMGPRMSYFIEIGGRGGSMYSGATVAAGLNLFLF